MRIIPETMRNKLGTGVVAAATSLCLALAPVGAAFAAEESAAESAEQAVEAAAEDNVEASEKSAEISAPEEKAGNVVRGAGAIGEIFKAYDTTRDDVDGIEAALKGVDIADEYTLQFEMSQPSESTDLIMLWSSGKDLKQLRAQVSDGYDGLVELDADITKDTLWFSIPGATPEPLTYDINEMSPNYLELLGLVSETDMPSSRYLPLISGFLLNMAGNADEEAADHAKDEVKSIIKDSFATLDAQEVTGTYEVDGEDVECAGYKFTFDNKFAGQMLEDCKPAVMDFVNAYWNPEFDQMTPYSVSTIAKLAYGMLILQATEIPQTWEFSVYMHNYELAALVLESEYTSYEVQFNGGDYRSQNMTLLIDGVEVSKIQGLIEDGVQMISASTEVTDEYGDSETLTSIFLCDLESGEYQYISGDESTTVEGVLAILNDETSFTAEVTSDDMDLDGMEMSYIKVAGAQDIPTLSADTSVATVTDEADEAEDADSADESTEADASEADAEGDGAEDAASSALEAFKSR